jgi:hypothetical protein
MGGKCCSVLHQVTDDDDIDHLALFDLCLFALLQGREGYQAVGARETDSPTAPLAACGERLEALGGALEKHPMEFWSRIQT